MKPNLITIEGQVSSPGFYTFEEGLRVSDIISRAGGFSPDAAQDDIFMTYPNGRSFNYKRWSSNPKVLDGSTIKVGKRKEEEPFNRTEYLSELTSIVANLAQSLAVFVLAKNN